MDFPCKTAKHGVLYKTKHHEPPTLEPKAAETCASLEASAERRPGEAGETFPGRLAALFRPRGVPGLAVARLVVLTQWGERLLVLKAGKTLGNSREPSKSEGTLKIREELKGSKGLAYRNIRKLPKTPRFSCFPAEFPLTQPFECRSKGGGDDSLMLPKGTLRHTRER